MVEPKRTMKDSVFTYLFRQPEYMKALYQLLHPEDTDVTESDFKLVTLENILTIGLYNDLGIQVKDRLILLMEAQSTFSANIPLRMLMYLASTYKEFVTEHMLSLYRETKVTIPRPALYVVYTGIKQDVPEELKLSSLYEGDGAAELTVKVLRNDGSGDILDQYIAFSQIFDAQVKEHGRTQQAMDETFKFCFAHNILTAFLESRKKEVLDIMTTLFDQETIWEIERYNIAQENRREGRQEGRREGRQEERAILLRQMLQNASILDVSRITGIPAEEIERLIKQ